MGMTIQEAWDSAEKKVFDELCAALQSEEGRDAFRGYLPVDRADVWGLASGGGVNGIEKMWDTNGRAPCTATQICNAVAMCVYSERSQAMQWAGKIVAALGDTKNMYQKGNVFCFRMLEQPSQPEIVDLNQEDPENPLPAWMVTIPFELVYITTDTWN